MHETSLQVRTGSARLLDGQAMYLDQLRAKGYFIAECLAPAELIDVAHRAHFQLQPGLAETVRERIFTGSDFGVAGALPESRANCAGGGKE